MILSKSKIIEEIDRNIFISPFNENQLNSNSYNLRISNKLLIYDSNILDMKTDNPYTEILIPDEGYILQPGELYLASTFEKTKTLKYIPRIEGRSSVARLGLFVHISASLGEAGFDGHWTLELTCIKPLKIYPYTPICQIYYNEISGCVDLCESEKYQYNTGVETSKMYKEFHEKGDQLC